MTGNTLTASSTESSPTNDTPNADNGKGTEDDISKEVFLRGNGLWVLSFILLILVCRWQWKCWFRFIHLNRLCATVSMLHMLHKEMGIFCVILQRAY